MGQRQREEEEGLDQQTCSLGYLPKSQEGQLGLVVNPDVTARAALEGVTNDRLVIGNTHWHLRVVGNSPQRVGDRDGLTLRHITDLSGLDSLARHLLPPVWLVATRAVGVVLLEGPLSRFLSDAVSSSIVLLPVAAPEQPPDADANHQRADDSDDQEIIVP